MRDRNGCWTFSGSRRCESAERTGKEATGSQVRQDGEYKAGSCRRPALRSYSREGMETSAQQGRRGRGRRGDDPGSIPRSLGVRRRQRRNFVWEGCEADYRGTNARASRLGNYFRMAKSRRIPAGRAKATAAGSMDRRSATGDGSAQSGWAP